MTGIGMMLKALGVNVTEQHVKMIEVLIPQIPDRLNQAVDIVNEAITRQDQRLTLIENRLQMLEEKLMQSFQVMTEMNSENAHDIVNGMQAIVKELENGRIETEVQHGRTHKRADSDTTTRSRANGSNIRSTDSSR